MTNLIGAAEVIVWCLFLITLGCIQPRPQPPLTPIQQSYVEDCHSEVMIGVHGETYHPSITMCKVKARNLYPDLSHGGKK